MSFAKKKPKVNTTWTCKCGTNQAYLLYCRRCDKGRP